MDEKKSMVELAVAVTMAWLGNQNTRCAPEDVHAFLKSSHATLVGFSQPSPDTDSAGAPPSEEFKPAVTARKSLADPDYIVSMIDGKRYRTLRRHLSTHGMTPEAYRERYGLKHDYPMVAPSYAAERSRLAKERGLGRKGATALITEATPSADASETSAPKPAAKKPRAPRARKAASPASEQSEA